MTKGFSNFLLVCKNPECSNLNKTFGAGHYRMKYDKGLDKMVPEFVGEIPICPSCSQKLQFMEVSTTLPTFGVSTFRGLPDDKKKEILRKRYEGGIKHEGGLEKEYHKRKNLAKMIGYDGE